MNPKEIGAFLKQLRNEKGITQEQLAEILGVSGRTVSRWETGTNLPDLSILVQISEYYDVEIKEILNGERKSEKMENELKETLLKVADYNELERRRAAKAGSISFSIMFLVCAVTIVVQMLMDGSFPMIIGETAALFAGGLVYIFFIVKNGTVITPQLTDSVLESITRDTIIKIARDKGYPVVERTIDRTELYTCEEAFLCGSAMEITPVLSIDKSVIGAGDTGRITKELHLTYLDAVRGKLEQYKNWVTPIY